MGLDLAAIDSLILSHGHFDHWGGLPDFLEPVCLASANCPSAMPAAWRVACVRIGAPGKYWLNDGMHAPRPFSFSRSTSCRIAFSVCEREASIATPTWRVFPSGLADGRHAIACATLLTMPAIEASHSRSTSACAADMLVELVKRGGRPTLHTSSYFGGMLRRRTIRLPTGTRSAGILGPAPTRTRPLPRSVRFSSHVASIV